MNRVLIIIIFLLTTVCCSAAPLSGAPEAMGPPAAPPATGASPGPEGVGIEPARPPGKLVVPHWPDSVKAAGGADGEIHLGREVFRKEAHPVKGRAPRGDITLNFVNTDIQEFAKAVLGDMLQLNYALAPSVQGAVTVKASGLRKEEVLPVVSTVLRLNGVALVKNGEMVKVIPFAEASKQGTFLPWVGRGGTPGVGLEIVALRYVGADEMRRMLEAVAPAGGVVPVESARNVLVLSGTEEERTAMMDVVQSFDIDWLGGMSFGLFPLKEASAKDVAKQLWEVMGTATGPLAKMLRLVALDRQNAVLAISSQPRYVKEVKKWIERLDVNRAPADQRMWVYAVQNGRAADLAETLNKLVGNVEAPRSVSLKSDSSIPVPPPLPVATLAEANNTPLPAAPPSGQPDRPNSAGQGLRVIADETTNSLIIMGSKADFLLIEEALKKLDVVPLQVRIEAVIAEVTLTDDLRYGVQYLFKNKNVAGVLTKANAVGVSPTLPGFSAFIMSSQISAVLDLLQSVTTVHVISSPQLMVLNNQTATLQIGDQVPIATQSAVSVVTPGAPVVNSIQLKDTGVILRVTPRVNASGMVVMDISQEVSDVAKTTTSALDSPTIQQRKIASSVAVHDGETVALGGLIKDSVTNGRDGIPVLEDIPLAGALFSSTTTSNARTELLVLITPRVVRNDRDIRAVTQEMRERMNAVAPLDAKIRATSVRR